MLRSYPCKATQGLPLIARARHLLRRPHPVVGSHLSLAELYPRPFYLRPLAFSRRPAVQALTVLGMLVVGGLLARHLSDVQAHFPDYLLFLWIYAAVVAFGIWALSYAYERTKTTFVSLQLHTRLADRVAEIYATPRMAITALSFALFVVFVQFALRFRVPPQITIYLLIWNFIAGFIAGLGIWTAVGSIRLAVAIGRCELELYDLYPAETPSLRLLASLMWTHSFLFASEILIFSLATTWASITLRDRATPIYGRFSALDI